MQVINFVPLYEGEELQSCFGPQLRAYPVIAVLQIGLRPCQAPKPSHDSVQEGI